METGGESAHKLHVIFLYPHHRPAEENLGGEGSSGGRENALHLPWSQASRGVVQPCSCGEMGHCCSRCGAPSGTGRVSASQLGVEKTTAGVRHPPAYAAGACSGLPAESQGKAGVSRPCPEEHFPTPRIPSKVNFRPSWPTGRWERVNPYLLTTAANEGG